MSYFPNDVPDPEPTIDDAPFWKFCRERQLKFQKCVSCGTVRHPPTPACRSCQSTSSAWVDASGPALLYSFTVVHVASHDSIKEALPYNVAIVRFPDLGDISMVSNVMDAAADTLVIDMPLELVWDARPFGAVLPRFKRAPARP